VVEESVTVSKLNALVQVIGFEEGRNYYRHFAPPGAFAATLEQIRAQVEKRGLPNAKIRRVALSSWSTGYGAIAQILSQSENDERVDSVLLLEGLLAGWLDDESTRVDPNKIAPFVRFAKLAVDKKKLLAITHSNARARDYASTRTVTDAMLETLKIERQPAKGTPSKVDIKAAHRLFPKEPRYLEADSRAQSGEFHVLGYKGAAAEDHIAHLAQMSVTVLPLLVARWDRR
jgi:hypothetical protein